MIMNGIATKPAQIINNTAMPTKIYLIRLLAKPQLLNFNENKGRLEINKSENSVVIKTRNVKPDTSRSNIM